MFFDTTRAHVELAGACCIDCVVPEAKEPSHRAKFKGNMDISRLESLIQEHGAQHIGLKEIIYQIFAYADLFMMSAKKDGIVIMGGMIGVKNAETHSDIIMKIKAACISFEGFITYGGLNGRDLEALAIGLEEGLNEDYLTYRIDQMEYLAARLDDAGIAYQAPVGGHGVFVDAAAMFPQIPYNEFPGQVLG